MSGIKIYSVTLFALLLFASGASAEVELTLKTGEARYFEEDIFILVLLPLQIQTGGDCEHNP